jgi:hypothetical protein
MKRQRFSIKMSLLLQLCTSAMKGWFDAFRYDGGPTLYSFNNRTAVTGDVTLITFLTIFCTLYVAFLIIFPGIRKERFTTFFAVTLSLFVGATILGELLVRFLYFTVT